MYASNRNITLNQYFDEWERSRQCSVKESTQIRVRREYNGHIRDALGGSVRDIPLNDTIKDILRKQREKMAIFNGNIIDLAQTIFKGSYGAYVSNVNVNYEIRSVLKRLEKKEIKIERFTCHAFRDTFATRYIEEGGSAQVLKTILGHSSLAMTMDLYSHVMPDTKQQEMELIEKAFKMVTG